MRALVLRRPLASFSLFFAAISLVACAEPAGEDPAATTSGDATTSSAGVGGASVSATSAGTGGAASSVTTSAGQGGSGGAGGQMGVGGQGGQGGSVLQPDYVGCSDGTREGYGNIGVYKYIAACGGAWDMPGIFNMPVSCNRQAGNTGVNAAGTGCTVSDLCAEGWHVCYGKDDVILKNPGGCAGVMDGAVSPVFFTSQMSSVGAFQCSTAANATNDLFGCGDLGCDFTSNQVVQDLCAPLVMSSHDLCKGLRNDLNCGDWCNHLGKYPGLQNGWTCGSDGANEALNVTKSVPDQGGVLCCTD